MKRGNERLRREIECLKAVKEANNNHVIELVDVIDIPQNDKIYMVFELITNGTLEQLIEDRDGEGLPESWVKWCVQSCACTRRRCICD